MSHSRSASTCLPIGASAAALLTLLLWVLNVPFYSGAGGEHWSWRMEHGRFSLQRREHSVAPESFYVAPNSEGLRFAPGARFVSVHEWRVDIPLWVPLAASLVLAGWGASRLRPTPDEN